MKPQYYVIFTAALAAMTLSSCTTGGRTADATYPVNGDLEERRVYTQEQHKKTGRTGNAGEALEQLDPSVRISGGR